MSECQHRWVDVTVYEVPERARYLCMNCRDKWEGEPTKPGWYWFREHWKGQIGSPRIVHVRSENGILIVDRTWLDVYDNGQLVCASQELKKLDGEWAGPLEPPA